MTLREDTDGFTSRFVETNGIRLHALEGGPEDGPLTLLLHGFPEMHLAWRHQFQPLARAGLRVTAPDLRGYNTSDKPPRVADYAMHHLIDDVAGLVLAYGRTKANIVAHDWGGAVAWNLAHRRPDLVDKLVILNSPHPRVFLRRLRGIEQLVASWYMVAFQVPGLAERMLRRPEAVERLFKGQPRIKGAYDDEDIAAYREAWAQPRALESMLAWYRAAFRGMRGGSDGGGQRTITAPTLVLWGMDDEALPPGNLDGLERYVERLEIVRVPNCSHWIMHDAHKLVNERLVQFLAPAP